MTLSTEGFIESICGQLFCSTSDQSGAWSRRQMILHLDAASNLRYHDFIQKGKV